MNIAITGASGLIGTALVAALHADGHRVVRVVRSSGSNRAEDGEVARWDPIAGTIDAGAFDGLDGVVHLAGEGIGDRRWTAEQKARILESRTKGTSLLAETLAALGTPPAVLVSGSAVGWYGNRGDEQLTEESPPPEPLDFAADVCRQWEAATRPAADAGIRTVHIRTGIVLATSGGALKRMLTPFRFGLGGRIGSGRQYMSWITLADEVGAIRHALADAELHGPVNATAPNPVTNLEFTKALGRALHRPTALPTPLAPLKAVYGAELVQHLLVEGQRVLPSRLLESGYEFAASTIDTAFESVIHRGGQGAAD